MHGDLTITLAHRTALRRIRRGEPVGDLQHVLGSLYLAELIEDDRVNREPFVTELGHRLLDAAPTVKQERPHIARPAQPDGWTDHGSGVWGWASETVTVSVTERADGDVSPPAVCGLGQFWMVAADLERAVDALKAWMKWRRDLAAWEPGS
jgi:hypothetical protein